MGEGCESWFPRPQFDWRFPYSSSLAAPVSFGHLTTVPDMINPGTKMVATAAGILPVRMDNEPPNVQIGQVNEPHGWLHPFPRFRQAHLPVSNPLLKEQLLDHREAADPKAETGSAEKRFLVFDQSGEQTALFLSPDFGSHVKRPNLSSKLFGVYSSKEEDRIPKEDPNLHRGSISADALDGDGTDLQSEMHEDTEELNALLYSDDDSDYTEEDDVTSTGHSPSTVHNRQCEEELSEEVASSGGTTTTRKRKLFDDSAPLFIDTASSVEPKTSSEYEDDAESSCANGKTASTVGFCSMSGNKRMRKENLRETVSLLRSLIPDGEGKDAIMVLDEAISYLKSLRFKVKDISCVL